MAIDKLNIQAKVDNVAKKKLVASNEIGVNETLLANEVNALVAKTNELIDAYNFGAPITAFNFKENVPTYADLPTEGNEVNDGYGVIEDGLVYVWNGEAFPPEGDGMNLGLKPSEYSQVEDGNPMAVSGNEVYKAQDTLYFNISEGLGEVEILPVDKSKEVFETRVNPTSMWADLNCVFSKEKKLNELKLISRATGNFIVKLFKIESNSAVIINEVQLTATRLGLNTFTADQLNIDDNFYIENTGEIHIALTNYDLSNIPVGYKTSTNTNSVTFPLNGGSVAFTNTLSYGYYIIVNKKSYIEELQDVSNMIENKTIQQIPYKKDFTGYVSKADFSFWWTDKGCKINSGEDLDSITIFGTNSGTCNIAFATITNSTATILYNENVAVTGVGVNILKASDLSIPEFIKELDNVYVLVANTINHNTSSQINYKASSTQDAIYINKTTNAVFRGNFDIAIYLNANINSSKLLETVNLLYDETIGLSISNENELQNYINNNRFCKLPEMDLILTKPLIIPNGTHITGSKKTIIKIPGNATFNIFNFNVNSENITIEDITLDGQNTITRPSVNRDYILNKTNIGSSKGIYINGYAKNIQLKNLEIKGFSHSGIHLYRTHASNYSRTVKITDCVVINNYIGLLSDVRSEYHTFIGNTFAYNIFGSFIAGGNNFGSCNHFDANSVGCVVSGTAGENDSHGSFGDCSFNHNLSYSAYFIDVNNGFTINGSHFFEGDICLDNSTGVVLNNGMIACGIQVVNERLGLNIISNNMFFKSYGGGSIGNKTYMSLKNNGFIDGSASTDINN